MDVDIIIWKNLDGNGGVFNLAPTNNVFNGFLGMFMKIEVQAMEEDISHESVQDELQILVANGSLLNTCVLKKKI